MLPPTLPQSGSGSDGEIIDEGGAEIKYSRDPITGNNDIYCPFSHLRRNLEQMIVRSKMEAKFKGFWLI